MSKIADQRAAFDAWYNDPARKTYVHNECSAYSGWLAAKADASEQPVAVPDGWKLVPTELTEAMMLAAQDVPAPRPYGAVYRAMLAAAPAASAAQDDAKDAGRLVIEEKAQEIYSTWQSQPEFVAWQHGGNSHMQERARDMARVAITTKATS